MDLPPKRLSVKLIGLIFKRLKEKLIVEGFGTRRITPANKANFRP
jgi:hypothetical protein